MRDCNVYDAVGGIGIAGPGCRVVGQRRLLLTHGE